MFYRSGESELDLTCVCVRVMSLAVVCVRTCEGLSVGQIKETTFTLTLKLSQSLRTNIVLKRNKPDIVQFMKQSRNIKKNNMGLEVQDAAL